MEMKRTYKVVFRNTAKGYVAGAKVNATSEAEAREIFAARKPGMVIEDIHELVKA